MPIILLEGADLSGKSTLAQTLKTAWLKLGGPHRAVSQLHAGPPDPKTPIRDQYERAFWYMGECIAPPTDPELLVICDRWYLGELVYGPLLRGNSRLTPLMQRHLEGVLTSLGALQVVVDVTDELRAKRFAERGDDLVSLEQANRAAAAYRRLRPQLLTTYVDGAAQNPARTAGLLLTIARREAAAAAELWPLHRGGYVGPRRPELLLVGDRRNGGDLPAPFPPYSEAGCSSYLWETLASFPAVGLVNAHEPEHDGQLGAIVKALGSPRVVALGRQASGALGREGVPHGTVPHPQWWKRFRHHDQPEYAQAIRRAATTREDLINKTGQPT